MTTATASTRRRISAFAMLACMVATGCDGSDEPANIVEIERGDTGPRVDLEAYAEQRLADGAVTLIDAAVPDGTLMPATHSGPTWGELEEARKERERAAAEARANAEPEEEDEEPTRAAPPSPRPTPQPAAPAPAPQPPVLTVDPRTTE